jgi:hypothetical protein
VEPHDSTGMGHCRLVLSPPPPTVCIPTLAYLPPRSVISKHHIPDRLSNLTRQRPATGFGSQLSKNEHAPWECVLDGEVRESEKNGRHINVKDYDKPDWQSIEHSDTNGKSAIIRAITIAYEASILFD